MRLLASYFSALFLKNYFIGLLGLVGIHTIQAMMSHLLEQGYSLGQAVTYQSMFIPEVAVQMTPPAVLVATVFTLAGLNRTQELTACYSIGIGLGQILTVFLSLVVVICCFSLVFQDRILPPVYKNRTHYYWRELQKKTDFHLDVRQDKIWYRSKDLIYNLKTFDPKTKTIQGMTVYAFDSAFRLVRLTEAQSAVFTPQGWELRNGAQTSFTGSDRFPTIKKFESMTLQIPETPQEFQSIEKEVSALRLKEIWRHIQRLKGSGIETRNYEVDFHAKLSLSFLPIVMCLLAVPFSVGNRRQGGLARDLGICLGVTFIYWLIYSVGLSLGRNGAAPPILAAWAPSILFLGFAVALLSRKKA